MVQLYDHPLITVWLHPRSGIVHHKVRGPILSEHGETFQEALLAGTRAVQEQGATKWLSDDRAHSVTPPEVQTWAREHWFPVTQQAGWRYWAIVEPETAASRLFIARLAATFSKLGVTTQFFQDEDKALDWLDSVGGED
jgi:hypothetical protein